MISRRLKHPQCLRRGFVLADVIGGIALLAAVASLLAVSLHRYYAASERLADSRDAARLAEDALTRLQTNQPPPTDIAGHSVRTEAVESTAPPKHHWVTVTAEVNHRVVTLTGLVSDGRTTP